MSVRRPIACLAIAFLLVSCDLQAAPVATATPGSGPAGVVAPKCDLTIGPRQVLVSAARRRELGLKYWPDMTLAVERQGDDAYTFYGGHGGGRDGGDTSRKT